MNRYRYSLILTATLAGCLLLQYAALRRVGGRTTKSESNYFSSLGRIQAGARDNPAVMLLGSSITGRLPDRANGFDGFANMGCDGGSAVDVLRAMELGLLPVAPVLVVEVNTLGRALDSAPSKVGEAMSRAWFQAGLRMPLISAYARPSAFLYSFLLAQKIGGFGDPREGPDLKVSSKPGPLPEHLVSNQCATPREIRLADELSGIVGRLRERGSRVIFIWVPPGRGGDGTVPAWIGTLVRSSGAEWWDVGHEADQTQVLLTDGVHMSADSAARTVRTLAKEIP